MFRNHRVLAVSGQKKDASAVRMDAALEKLNLICIRSARIS